MVDNNTLFKITKDTYQHKGVKGWPRLHEFDGAADRLSGLNSTVSKSGNDIVIAFIGTNPIDIRDLASNLNVWVQHKKSHRSKDAGALFESVAKKYPEANIQFTGYFDGASKAIELPYKTTAADKAVEAFMSW